MSDIFYFDANILVYRAQAAAGSLGDQKLDLLASEANQLVSSGSDELFISDLGVWEFRNTLAKLCRRTDADAVAYDSHWMNAQMRELMTQVSVSRIRVLTYKPRVAAQAAALVERASAVEGRALFVWDTVHVLTAAALGRERGTQVEVVTADSDLRSVVAVYPQMGRYVSLRQR